MTLDGRTLARALFPVASALLAVTTGCNRPAEGPVLAETAGSPGPTIRPIRPQRATVRRVIVQPGYNIEPFQRTPIYAKLAGYVRLVKADIGDPVEPRQLLAELSVPELDAQRRQKDAAVRQAAAEIMQARAATRRAEAELRRARSQYERLSRLGGSGGVLDRENVDETRLGAEVALAAVQKAQADVGVAQARHEAARQDLGHIDALLGYTHLVAPFKGVVSRRNVDVGHLVQPAAGTRDEPLFVVDDLERVRVFVDVPAADAVWVRRGDPAGVRVPGLSGAPFVGTVTRDAHTLQPNNRTLRTEIDLPNPDHRLLPGMFAYVTITPTRPNVWTLPVAAIAASGDNTYCYRVEEGHARRTRIQVGLAGDDLVEVTKIEEGEGSKTRWRDMSGNDQFLATVPPGEPIEVSLPRK